MSKSKKAAESAKADEISKAAAPKGENGTKKQPDDPTTFEGDSRKFVGRKNVPFIVGPSGTVYDLRERGAGVLLTVICEFRPAIEAEKPTAEQMNELADFLAARDLDCGKPAKADYRKQAAIYRAHARKHLGLGKKACSCNEIGEAYLGAAPEFAPAAPTFESVEAAKAATAPAPKKAEAAPAA